jgi:hypothetical protein
MATTATNTILTPDMITAKALVILHQKLNFVGSINKQYDSSFAQSGAKIGDTLRIRLPNQYVVRHDMTLAPQNTAEQNTSLTVSNVSGTDISFSTTDLTLKMDDFTSRVIEPAVAVIAADIESRALAMMLDVPNVINGQGSAQTFKNFLFGRKALLDNLAPQSKQWMARINTQTNVDLVDSLKGLFQSATDIKAQYTDGVMGYTAGFEFAENTHLSTFTRSAAVSYAVSTTATTGSTSLVVKTGTGTALHGEVFTVAGVNRIHPETKVDTGVLQQFVLTADAAGAGTQTWTISPAPTFASPHGARDNVSKLPTANDVITFVGTISAAVGTDLVYHPDAFTIATADLVMPGGVDMASRANKDGISIRLIRQYDINTDYLPCRLDVLWGARAIRPQLACRLFAN